MVSWRQMNLGTDDLIIIFTQVGLSMGSDVRNSVLKARPKINAMPTPPQRYRGARSSRAGTEGSVIHMLLNGSPQELVLPSYIWADQTLFALPRALEGEKKCFGYYNGVLTDCCRRDNQDVYVKIKLYDLCEGSENFRSL